MTAGFPTESLPVSVVSVVYALQDMFVVACSRAALRVRDILDCDQQSGIVIRASSRCHVLSSSHPLLYCIHGHLELMLAGHRLYYYHASVFWMSCWLGLWIGSKKWEGFSSLSPCTGIHCALAVTHSPARVLNERKCKGSSCMKENAHFSLDVCFGIVLTMRKLTSSICVCGV